MVKCDRHPLERVGRLTDYSVVPHPARDCDSRDAGAGTCVCIKAFPASGVGRGPGRSNTKSRSRSGSDAGRATKGVPADVIQSQLFYFDVLRRGFCTLLLAVAAGCTAVSRDRCCTAEHFARGDHALLALAGCPTCCLAALPMGIRCKICGPGCGARLEQTTWLPHGPSCPGTPLKARCSLFLLVSLCR